MRDSSAVMDEIEVLRALGVRRTAALGLVAERHSVAERELDDLHFSWLMRAAGADDIVHGVDTEGCSM